MSLNLKTKINPWLTPYYSLSIQNMLYESFVDNKKKDKNLNNLTASATLLPKELIYHANFDDHYVKSRFQFLSMFLIISGSSNGLKNLFSRHPDIPEASRNDP